MGCGVVEKHLEMAQPIKKCKPENLRCGEVICETTFHAKECQEPMSSTHFKVASLCCSEIIMPSDWLKFDTWLIWSEAPIDNTIDRSVYLPRYVLLLVTSIISVTVSQMIATYYTKVLNVWSGCGSVGRVVAFDTRGPWFDSSHQQKIYWTFVCLLVYYQLYWKDENKLKEARDGPL